MTFTTNERPLFTEIFGPIIGLKEEWEEQGATAEELDFSAFAYRCPGEARVPVGTGRLPGKKSEVEILEETDEYRLFRDDLGRVMKLPKQTASLPLPLDFPVKDMDDWLKLKPRYEWSEERFCTGWQQTVRNSIDSDRLVTAYIPGGYDEPRQLMGDAQASMAFYEQPELINDMLQTIGNTAARVLERVSREFPIDVLFVHEDLAGRGGPLVTPDMVREFLVPYYRTVWDMLSERGTRLFQQDSDGDVNAVIEPFLEAGINVMMPMEPAAGMDIVDVRRRYGNRLALVGGIDKHVLRRSKEEIAAELDYKIPPMLESGGCLLGLDHRIPNGTPLENYRFYLECVWEMLEVKNAII